MRAVRYHEFGGPEVLGIEEVEPLEPRTDEVRVDVAAAGVNPCDALRREGLWGDDLPLIPGSDLAGTVEAVGDEDGPFAVGDRVFGTVPMLNAAGSRGDRQGTYAERATVRTDRLATLPDGVSFDAGAAAGIVCGTAWRALYELGDLPPGGTALVHGGTGGVGHVAVQLATAMGARVVATASADRLDRLRELGADRAIDYAREDLQGAIEAAAPRGADLILEHMVERRCDLDVAVAAPGCDLLVIGNNHDQPRIGDLTAAIGKDLTVQPFDAFNLDPVGGTLERIGRLMETGAVSIEIARGYGLDEAAEAHRAVTGDSFVGKLVVRP